MEVTKSCAGEIYRLRINSYVNDKGHYVYQEKMIPMRRMSCPGCAECGYLSDCIADAVSCDTPPIIQNPEDKALYYLAITNESRDWETGIVDDWDLEFVKINSRGTSAATERSD